MSSCELTTPSSRTSDSAPMFGTRDSGALDNPPPTMLLDTPALSTFVLVAIRGQTYDAKFPLYDGTNLIGRTGDHPVDIDVTGLENPDQVWSSRQHAVIYRQDANISIEDLNSLNGTFVNRAKLHAGKRYVLKAGDIVQIGTLQFKLAKS